MHKRYRGVFAGALLLVVLAVAASPGAGVAAGSVDRGTISATLNGAGEVPKVATGATGKISVTLDAKTGKVCWNLTTGINIARSADIHQAPKGKTGRSVVPLGAKFLKKGCVISPLKVVKGILSNPAAYYVNIHTKKYPDGIIAGRLHR